jgi:predicted site-specific integrase-resolvase
MWISAREVREFYGITSQTLYNWRNKNNIVFKRLPSGKIVYDVSETKQENIRKNVLKIKNKKVYKTLNKHII